MNYMLLIESFGGYGASDDLGIVLLLAVPILLLIALIFLVIGLAKKNNKPKMFKIAAITFIAAGVSALVGMGQCGWY